MKFLALASTYVGGAGMQPLANLHELRSLDLDDANVSNEGLRYVGDIRGLRSLGLFRNRAINDVGVRYLSALTLLEHLYLGTTGISDKGVESLSTLTALKELNLQGTKVGDGAMTIIAALPRIEKLDVTWTEITDAGLRELEHCKTLRAIDAGGKGHLTDAGYRELTAALPQAKVNDGAAAPVRRWARRRREVNLSGLIRLPTLTLGHNKITGSGLKHLKGLTQLRELSLDTTA